MKMMRAPLVLALLGASVAFAQVNGRFANLSTKQSPALDIAAYGAVCDGVLATGTATSGATSITVASSAGISAGMAATGAGIPAGATVASVSGTTVTISAATTASLSGTAVGFGHDDSAAISAASTAAGSIYASSNHWSTVLITHGKTGVCLLSHPITYQSGSHFVGSGAGILNEAPGIVSFNSGGLGGDTNNVEFDHMDLVQTTAGAAPVIFYVGGTATGQGVPVQHLAVKNSTIHGGGYGILIDVYSQGDGYNHHLSDVQITNNHVYCDLLGGAQDANCRDGIHVSGDISDFAIDGNIVENRDDAAIAITSSGGSLPTGFAGILARLTPTNGTISHNVCSNSLVGLDFSGGNNIVAAGDVCISSIPNTVSSPAIRFIKDQYPLPTSIRVIGGIFSNDATGADQATVKMDFTGASSGGVYPLCKCEIDDAEIGYAGTGGLIYLQGNGFRTHNVMFDAGIALIFGSENGSTTQDVYLTGSTWMGSSRSIVVPPFNGGLSHIYLVDDLYGGTRSTVPITWSTNGSAAWSVPVVTCGAIPNGTASVADCYQTQNTYAGGTNPTTTHATTHLPGGSSGTHNYSWDGNATFAGTLSSVYGTIGLDYYWTATGCALGTGQPSRCTASTTLPGAMPDANWQVSCTADAGTQVGDYACAVHATPLPTASGGVINYALVQVMQNGGSGGTPVVYFHAHHN